MLTVVEGTEYTVKHKKRAKYTCDCGNVDDYLVTVVVNKRRTMCKVCTKRRQNEDSRIDLTNKRFGSLVAVKFSGSTDSRVSIWECICDCGASHSVRMSDLSSGKTKRCPACKIIKQREDARNRSHYGDGPSDNHRLYNIWKSMNNRAFHKTSKGKWYDDVDMCQEWRDFKVFRKWAEDNGYTDELCIDKDILCDHLKISPKVYSPDTCLWITREVNARYAATKDLIVKEKIRREYVLV